LFLKIGINIPFPQLSGIIPLSNIILNNNHKENYKDISMEVLYNHFENLNKNNFDDGNIDIDIDVNNLSPEMDNILNSPKFIFKSKLIIVVCFICYLIILIAALYHMKPI
jgi:hypothetical protein